MRGELAVFQDQVLAALLGDSPQADVHSPLSPIALRVHRNTVHGAAIDALAANFPAVVDALGLPDFRAAAADFVRSEPPADPRLITYGERFPAFLANAGADGPAALAWLDRAWTEAHIASSAEPLAAAILANADPTQLARLRVAPHPATRWGVAEAVMLVRWSSVRGVALAVPASATHGALLLSRPRDAVIATPCHPGLVRLLDTLPLEPRLLDAAMAVQAIEPEFDVGSGLASLLAAGALILEPANGVDP